MFLIKLPLHLFLNNIGHKFSTNSLKNFKVCCVGAVGGIGQPLSLLLKLNPCITKLSLFDVVNSGGVATDLSHIESKCKVSCNAELESALKGSDIVIIPAGVPRKPGMTRDDLFSVNCKVMHNIANAISCASPKAIICIITNPVNSIVPLAAEIFKKNGTYDKSRLFGVTTLDLVRARTFISEILNINPCSVDIPVIGGHAGKTILPIISQCKPEFKKSDEEIAKLVTRIQDAGTEVVKAKEGTGSATLSMAYAGASFINTVICGLKGDKNIKTYSYVDCDVTKAKFFATLVHIGKSGIKEVCDLPKLNDCEQEQLNEAVQILQKEIKKGTDFIKKKDGD